METSTQQINTDPDNYPVEGHFPLQPSGYESQCGLWRRVIEYLQHADPGFVQRIMPR